MKVHLIGIGGTGMGALAGLLAGSGHEVRGSDGPLYPPMSTLLAGLGIEVYQGHRPANLDWGPEVVVVGNVCRPDHVEARAAMDRGLRCVSFPSLLSELFLAGRSVLVVAGTHGKTTTTSLAVHLLCEAGLAPGFLVGGIPCAPGQSFSAGTGPHFVVEGDEYDCAFFDKRPKFVHYRPHTVILTGVELDHIDIYPDLDHVKQAFAMLLQRVPADGRILVCADSQAAVDLCRQAICPVQTYGVRGEPAEWQGVPGSKAGAARQTLAVRCRGVAQGELELPLSGVHNLENALAAAAAASSLGVPWEKIAKAMATFGGVRRRQEVRGRAAGVTVIDDFAHHPTAIRETLRGLRGVHGPGALVAVFEPRSATSRRSVFQQAFARALAEADRVVVAGLHAPEGICEAERLDPARLVADLRAAGREAAYLERPGQIVDHLLPLVGPGDTVVVMSSGGFGGLPDSLVAALQRTEAHEPDRQET